MSDIAFAGAARQAEMVRAGEVSPTELVRLHLERIERLDPQLNSFRVVLAERALLEAEQAEARLKGGDERPLLGVPIALKDDVDLAGEQTTLGTDAFPEPAAADSEMVRRLREAGAIVVGKTLLPELAICGFTESATYGVTRNPWNPQRTPGGSSGGSAAAVAAGLVPIASASDGAGSIRIPAACCGLFGLKPQRGRISLAPHREHWNGLSVNGCVSRTVLDTALWLDVDQRRLARSPGRRRRPSGPSSSRRRRRRASCGSPARPCAPRAAAPPTVSDVVKGGGRRHRRAAALARPRGRPARPRLGRDRQQLVPRYLRGVAEDVAEVPHPGAARTPHPRLRPARHACFPTGLFERAAARRARPTPPASTRSSTATTC